MALIPGPPTPTTWYRPGVPRSTVTDDNPCPPVGAPTHLGVVRVENEAERRREAEPRPESLASVSTIRFSHGELLGQAGDGSGGAPPADGAGAARHGL